MKRSMITLVVLCVCVGSLSAVASSAVRTYGGTTSLRLANFRLSGTLSSPLPACERGRRITVYALGAGGHVNAAGFGTTKANGSWVTGTGFFDPNGAFKATTPAKVLPRQGGRRRVCKAVSKRRRFKSATPAP